MKIKNWHVMKDMHSDNNKTYYFYGHLEDFPPKDVESLTEVPYEKWAAKDFAGILGNILEDRNHHWMTDIPNMILEILDEAAVSENQKNFVMKKFCEKMENEKFK